MICFEDSYKNHLNLFYLNVDLINFNKAVTEKIDFPSMINVLLPDIRALSFSPLLVTEKLL